MHLLITHITPTSVFSQPTLSAFNLKSQPFNFPCGSVGLFLKRRRSSSLPTSFVETGRPPSACFDPIKSPPSLPGYGESPRTEC